MKVPGLGRSGDVNPFEAWALFAAEVQGVVVMLGLADPASVRNTLGDAVYVWAFVMAAGGATSLTGLFWWGSAFNEIEIRRVGMVACGVGAAVYSAAALFMGSKGLTVAIYNAAFAAACGVSAYRLSQVLRQVHKRLAGPAVPGGAE